MSWFAAHLLMYVEWKDEPQDRYPLWENIVLIRARLEEEAFAKAERRGREDEGDDDGRFRWAGRPARWVFAGVRKLTACEDPTKRPGDGTEVSDLEWEVDSKERIDQLLDERSVALKIQDRFRAEMPKRTVH